MGGRRETGLGKSAGCCGGGRELFDVDFCRLGRQRVFAGVAEVGESLEAVGVSHLDMCAQLRVCLTEERDGKGRRREYLGSVFIAKAVRSLSQQNSAIECLCRNLSRLREFISRLYVHLCEIVRLRVGEAIPYSASSGKGRGEGRQEVRRT